MKAVLSEKFIESIADKPLSTRLLLCRKELALTQAELAYQAGIGERTIRRIEHGKDCEQITLLKLEQALGLSEGFLYSAMRINENFGFARELAELPLSIEECKEVAEIVKIRVKINGNLFYYENFCNESMADKLYHCRKYLGWTQKELAIMAGVSEATISRIECGFSRSRHKTLLKLERALHLPRGFLSGLKEDPKKVIFYVLAEYLKCDLTAVNKFAIGAANLIIENR